jgi:hypothetical protein
LGYHIKTLTDSSEFADIYLRGVQQFDDLSPAERVRFSAFVGTALSNIEELYYYHKDGTLDAPHWGEVERTMTDIVAYPGHTDLVVGAATLVHRRIRRAYRSNH